MSNESTDIRTAHGRHGRRQLASWVVALAICIAGCQPDDVPPAPGDRYRHDAKQFAEARIGPVGGSGVGGLLRFNQDADFFRIEGRLSGLPAGAFSLRVPGYDNCDKASAASANDAANLGDFEASDGGIAAFELVDTLLNLGTDDHSLLNRAIVVVSDGQPIGCGVISLVPAADYTL